MEKKKAGTHEKLKKTLLFAYSRGQKRKKKKGNRKRFEYSCASFRMTLR